MRCCHLDNHALAYDVLHTIALNLHGLRGRKHRLIHHPIEPRSLKWGLHKTKRPAVRQTLHRMNINLGRTSSNCGVVYGFGECYMWVRVIKYNSCWLITLGETMFTRRQI